MRILLVEDDRDFREALSEELGDFFALDTCSTGKDCLYQAAVNPYDAIVLDIGLPDMHGIAVCKELRSRNIGTPVLMLTGELQVTSKVSALDGGADDYLTKPCDATELAARLRALMRRPAIPVHAGVITLGHLSLNPATREVSYGSVPIPLRRKEFDLLEFLLSRQAVVITREEILDHVWDSSVNSFTNAVDVHINRLRQKIDRTFGVRLIDTVHGVGYRINPSFGVEPLPVTVSDG